MNEAHENKPDQTNEFRETLPKDSWLTAYVLGELPDVDLAQMEARLAADESLREEMKDLQRFVTLLANTLENELIERESAENSFGKAGQERLGAGLKEPEANRKNGKPNGKSTWLAHSYRFIVTAVVVILLVPVLGVLFWHDVVDDIHVVSMNAPQSPAETPMASKAEIPATSETETPAEVRSEMNAPAMKEVLAVEEASVAEAPVVEALKKEAPAMEALTMEDALAGEALDEEAPVGEALKEEAPAEEASAVEEALAEAPATEAEMAIEAMAPVAAPEPPKYEFRNMDANEAVAETNSVAKEATVGTQSDHSKPYLAESESIAGTGIVGALRTENAEATKDAADVRGRKAANFQQDTDALQVEAAPSMAFSQAEKSTWDAAPATESALMAEPAPAVKSDQVAAPALMDGPIPAAEPAPAVEPVPTAEPALMDDSIPAAEPAPAKTPISAYTPAEESDFEAEPAPAPAPAIESDFFRKSPSYSIKIQDAEPVAEPAPAAEPSPTDDPIPAAEPAPAVKSDQAAEPVLAVELPPAKAPISAYAPAEESDFEAEPAQPVLDLAPSASRMTDSNAKLRHMERATKKAKSNKGFHSAITKKTFQKTALVPTVSLALRKSDRPQTASTKLRQRLTEQHQLPNPSQLNTSELIQYFTESAIPENANGETSKLRVEIHEHPGKPSLYLAMVTVVCSNEPAKGAMLDLHFQPEFITGYRQIGDVPAFGKTTTLLYELQVADAGKSEIPEKWLSAELHSTTSQGNVQTATCTTQTQEKPSQAFQFASAVVLFTSALAGDLPMVETLDKTLELCKTLAPISDAGTARLNEFQELVTAAQKLAK